MTLEDLSPEEREVMKQRRNKGFTALRKFSLFQLFISVIFFIVGIITVVFAAENPQFPYIACAPVWVSVIIGCGAICGYLAASNGLNRNDVPTKVKGFFIANYVVNVSCISLSCIATAWGGWGLGLCLSKELKNLAKCAPNITELTATSATTIAVGIVVVITCIMGCCFFCFLAKAMGFKSKREMRLERRMMRMQRELDAARAANPNYSQGQNNKGFSEPPPAYYDVTREPYYKW